MADLAALVDRCREGDPLAWEALHPVATDGVSEEQRERASECEQEFWADVQPEFACGTFLPDGFVEDAGLLTADFLSYQKNTQGNFL